VKGEYVVTSINANTELIAEAFALRSRPPATAACCWAMWRGSRWARKLRRSARSTARRCTSASRPPRANPLDVIKEVRGSCRSWKPAAANLKVSIAYDATLFIQASIDEVIKTLFEAVLIVIVVVFLFLGALRSVVIPVVTIRCR
jgi:multidrug efflux pump